MAALVSPVQNIFPSPYTIYVSPSYTGVGGDSAVQIVLTYSILVVVLVQQERVLPLLTRYKIVGEIRSFCCSHGCVVETEAK